MLSKLDSSKGFPKRRPISHTKKNNKNERGVSLEKLVAILDDMPEYGRRLAMYLNSAHGFPYRAVVFATAGEMEGYIRNDGVYAVLAAEGQEKDVLDVAVGTQVKLFWLCERRDSSHFSRLYRYTSAREIEQRLLGSGDRITEGRIPVLGFFSPAGGCEAEPFSRRVADKLGEAGKVLYVSAFPFGICGRENSDGLSEALYSVRQGAEGLQKAVEPGVHADSIGPVRWYTDLESITREDMEVLLQKNLWDVKYRAFFVAVGQFDTVGKTILNCCDFVLVPVWETESGGKIQAEFRRQLKESGETKLYAALLEVPVKETFGSISEESVALAAKKGEEAMEGAGR